MPTLTRMGLASILGAFALAAGCGSDRAPPGAGPGAPDAQAADAAALDDAGGKDAEGEPAPPATGHVSVTTQHNDLARTGANLAETALTTANVNKAQFGKLFCRAVDDEVYTQPLVVAGVDVPGRGVRDVLYVATVNDTVYAFDASDPAASEPLWSRTFLSPGVEPPRNTDMTGACGGRYSDFSGNIGIVSTPVIDLATRTMYLVARTKENGSTYVQKLHALDMTDGAERPNSPSTIEATVPGTGEGGTTITFNPQKQNQRSSLLLLDGVVYIGWASHCDWGPYHGWFMGYDAKTLQRVVTHNTTPDGAAGGIWMSGQAPSADSAGNIYLATGNGTIGRGDNPRDLKNRGESFLRLVRAGAGLSVASFFTPFDHERLEAGDLDLGSAGLLLVPETNLAVSGGKGGTLYVVDRTTMGGLSTQWNDSQIVQSFPLQRQHHLHGSPVYWKGPGGPLVYTWAEFDHLKAFRLDAAKAKLDEVPLAASAMNAPDGMPGGMLSISAAGAKEGTGILWANLPYRGDANQAVVSGMVRAFDAANVGVELWNSRENAPRDDFGKFAKFTPPTIANGKVYVSTFSSAVCAYGLLPNVTALAAPTSLAAVATSTTQVTLTWLDRSTDETSFSVERKEGALGFAPLATAPANATTIVDATATPFATYTYRVRAIGTGAPSAYSNTATVTVDVGAPAPRLRITGGRRLIALGAAAPSANDDTDFGSIAGNAVAQRTYTLQNIGNAPLDVLGSLALTGAGASAFAIATPPPASVAAGGTATFTIAFQPTTPGPKRATAALATNDPGQPSYSFAIGGEGVGDLRAQWALDEAAGQVAADASGHGNDGAGTALTWGLGRTGNAAAFNGTTSLIRVASTGSLNPRTLTIAAFIRPADWAGNRRILQKGAFDDQYRLLAENGVLVLDVAGVGTLTAPLPAANVWTHVAGTYDLTTLRLFVNGASVATVATTAALHETDDPLFIGSKRAGAPAGDHFKGAIDDVRIYGRALSAAEIAALAQ